MIYLASRSPRRLKLLKQIGVEFEIIDVGIDEHWDGREAARDHVRRLALQKARAGKAKLAPYRDIVVIGADTAVVLDEQVLGKADSREEAERMLHQLSGRTHHVYSAVALVTDATEAAALSISRVTFRILDDKEIKTYCATGEPLGKAGAYAIQGRAAAFIERLDGSCSGVMGLPLFETAQLLKGSDPFL